MSLATKTRLRGRMGVIFGFPRLVAVGVSLMCCNATAGAQAFEADPAGRGGDISANVGVVSDYRFRGLSYSDRDPALQGGLDAAFASGWFVGTWASTIANASGANVEIDLYGGYSGEAAGLTYSAAFYGYVYPGGRPENYFELMGTVGKAIGPAQLELQLAYTPDQWNSDRDNLYVSAAMSVAVPGTPLSAKLRGGRENGSYDNKWDWEAGVSYSHRWLTASAFYVGSNYSGADEAGRMGSDGFVGSVIASF